MSRDVKVLLFIFIIFIVGRANKGLVLPPTTTKAFQEWKKRQALLLYPKKTDLNSDGIVNMKDFAILANEWLKESR